MVNLGFTYPSEPVQKQLQQYGVRDVAKDVLSKTGLLGPAKDIRGWAGEQISSIRSLLGGNEWDTHIWPGLRRWEGSEINLDGKDDGNWQGYEGDGSNWGSKGKGNKVGSKFGVTAMALAKHRNTSSYSITKKDIENLSQNEASEIMETQYFNRYGLGKIADKKKRIFAGIMAPLNNYAVKLVQSQNVRNVEDAVKPLLMNFKSNNINRPDYYLKYIRGWANRTHDAAGMDTFDTNAELFLHYPKLRISRVDPETWE